MGSKTTEKRWRHRFPHYKLIGGFLLPWKPEFSSNLSQNVMQPFPPPQWCYTSNLIKIGQLASEIYKFERVVNGRRRTDDGPLVYYKLTLWAFGSGELTTRAKGQADSSFPADNHRRLSKIKWTKSPRRTWSGRTLTIKINHYRSTALERSVIKTRYTTILGSAVIFYLRSSLII